MRLEVHIYMHHFQQKLYLDVTVKSSYKFTYSTIDYQGVGNLVTYTEPNATYIHVYAI